jgi:hypothetical protein
MSVMVVARPSGPERRPAVGGAGWGLGPGAEVSSTLIATAHPNDAE